MTPRMLSLVSALALLTPVAACDSGEAKDPAAGGGGGGAAAGAADQAADGAKGDSKDAKDGAGEGDKQAPAADEPAEPCKALVEATQAACRHELASGANTGCMMALQGIKTAAEQAGGKLFDLGDDNRKAAEMNCKIHLKKVKKKHDKVKDAPAVSWGPECSKYIKHYDDTCLATLGQAERDAKCSEPFNATSAPLRPDNVEGAEIGCGMAMQMK